MKRKILAFVALTFLSVLTFAQTYPVQVSTTLIPPYSPYLSDYTAPGTDKIGLNLMFNDPVRFELGVKLKVTIEGLGITIRTKPDFNPAPLYLHAGIPERLTGAELAPYFDPRNLEFAGIDRRQFERRGALPEGVYRICFEVWEYTRNLKVSNTGCATAWMILNDPPIVNIPFNGEKVRIQDPQMLLFQWTPRHSGSPNSAFTTEYDVELVEIRPKGRNPNDAMLTSLPIFTTTTQSTMLIYGPAETPLIPGQQYALRIRARSIAGADELDLFKNNGYSQVIMFQYGDQCLSPENIVVGSTYPVKIDASWEPLAEHTAFKIRYKEKNKPGAEWFEETTLLRDHSISGLRPATEYLVQVVGYCGVVSNENILSYTVKTAPVKDTDFSCGNEAAAITIDATTLKSSLKPFDVIESGDFKIILSEVSGGNGTFSGKGIASIPWFKFATFKVEFENIGVNQKNQVFEGNIRSVLVPGSEIIYEEGYIPVPEEEEGGGTSGGEQSIPVPDENGIVKVDSEVKSVTVDPNGGMIIITKENGDPVSVPRTPDPEDPDKYKETKVTDASGDTWTVASDGTVRQGPAEAPTGTAAYLVNKPYKDVGFGANQDGTFTFLTPAGSYVVLPNNVENVATFFGYMGTSFADHAEFFKEFLTVVPGTLRGFKIGERIFKARVQRSGESFALIGYFDQNSKPYWPGDFGLDSNTSYEQKSILHAFADFDGEKGLFLLRMVTTGINEFDGTEMLKDCFSFPVSPDAERKLILFKNIDEAGNNVQGQFSMTPEILDWAFKNYNGDDTYLIRNKIAELRALYPRFVNEMTLFYPDWSANTICSDAGASFEKEMRERFCNSVFVSGGGTVPIGSTQYSLKSDATIPTSPRGWLELFYSYLLERVGQHQETVVNHIADLNSNPAAIGDMDLDKIRAFINLAAQEDIKQLSESAILSLLSNILNHWTLQRKEAVKDSEGAVLKLLANVNPDIYGKVLKGLEGRNVFDQSKFLFEQMFKKMHDNFVFEDDNRLKMVKVLTKMVMSDKEFYQDKLDKAYEDFGIRTFTLEYNNFVNQLGKSFLYSDKFYQIIDKATSQSATQNLKIYDVSYKWASEQNSIEIWQHQDVGFYEIKRDQSVTLGPFDLIFFVNLSSVAADVASPAKLSEVPVPAVTLVYASDKAGLNTINGAIGTGLDVASLVLSGGAYGALRGAGKLYQIRKAFLIADMASSGLSITAMAAEDYSLENNSRISAVLHSLSAITGVASLGGIGVEKYESIRRARSFSRLMDQAKAATNSVEIPDKSLIEKFITEFKALDQADVNRIVATYPNHAGNAMNVAIKYLKDGVKAGNDAKIADAKDILTRIGKAMSPTNLLQFISKLPEGDAGLRTWLQSNLENGIMTLSTVDKTTVRLAVRAENATDPPIPVGTIKLDGPNSNSELIPNDKIRDADLLQNSQVRYVSEDGRYAIRCNAADCDIELGACFTAGTLIATQNGAVPIEDIREGQQVETYNHVCEERSLSKVIRTVKRSWYKLYRVIAGRDTIFATPSHPFYISGLKKYVSADSLKLGMRVLTLTGASLAIHEVKAIDTTVTVYNFEVAENHNYYVGEEGILVHNANRDCFFAKLGMTDEVNEKLTLKMESLGFTDETIRKFKADLENKTFFNGITENVELLEYWKVFSDLDGARAWVRTSVPLLLKMRGKPESLKEKVLIYYSKHQKPGNTGPPPFVHEGTPFDAFGHPNFVPEIPNMVGVGKIKYRPTEIPPSERPVENKPALNGKSSDLADANRWAATKFSDDQFQVLGSTRCKIKDPTSPFADKNGWVECVWHHHEDARTLIPVPVQTHNRGAAMGSAHTGGAAILDDPNVDLRELIGFFDSPTGL